MTTYLLIYKYAENYLNTRIPFHSAHIDHIKSHVASGYLLIGGATASPADKGFLVFAVDNPAIIENFAQNDPYVRNGVVTKWEIREWAVVIGHERLR